MLSGSGGCADASARPLRLTAACELGRGAAGGWHSASSPNPKPSWVQKGEGARRGVCGRCDPAISRAGAAGGPGECRGGVPQSLQPWEHPWAVGHIGTSPESGGST